MKMENKEDESKVSIVSLKSKTKDKIRYAKSMNKIDQKEVYNLIKDFFKEWLNLDYECTHEELIDELEKTYLESNFHKRVINFIKSIGIIEYTDKEFSQDELNKQLEELDELLDILVKGEVTHDESFLKKIFSHKKNSEELQKEIFEKEKILSNELDEGTLNEKIKEIENVVEENVDKAKEKYVKAMKYYEKLSSEKQKKYYPKLNDLYKKINSKN